MDFYSVTERTEPIDKKYLIFWIIKIIIAAGLLYYLITAVDLNAIILGIRKADRTYIVLALMLLPLNLYLQYLKWKVTAEYLLEEKNDKKIYRSLFLGFSAGIITPARIGEYFGRAAEFRDKSLLQVTTAVLLDKFFPLTCVAFFGSASSILFFHYFYNVPALITAAVLLILFILFYLFVLLLLNGKFWDNILFNKIRRRPKLNKFFSRLAVLKNLDRMYFLKMMLFSVLFYYCFILQYSLLASAFSHNFEIIYYMWAGNLVMFAKTVIPSISLGELGIREGASVFFLVKMGEPEYVGFNASIFLFLINVLIPAVIGIFFLFRKNND